MRVVEFRNLGIGAAVWIVLFTLGIHVAGSRSISPRVQQRCAEICLEFILHDDHHHRWRQDEWEKLKTEKDNLFSPSLVIVRTLDPETGEPFTTTPD